LPLAKLIGFVSFEESNKRGAFRRRQFDAARDSPRYIANEAPALECHDGLETFQSLVAQQVEKFVVHVHSPIIKQEDVGF